MAKKLVQAARDVGRRWPCKRISGYSIAAARVSRAAVTVAGGTVSTASFIVTKEKLQMKARRKSSAIWRGLTALGIGEWVLSPGRVTAIACIRERKSVVGGKGVSGRVTCGGRR